MVKSFNQILILVALISLSSCRFFYPDLMFKTKTEQNVQADTLSKRTGYNYRFAVGDKFDLTLYPNKGYQLIDILSVSTVIHTTVTYYVRTSGYAALPVIDSLKVVGLTVPEVEDKLKKIYSEYFVSPFVSVTVSNRRVSVIRSRSISTVVELENENMNLLEVLARSGGLSAENKARRVKIIRGDLHHPVIRFIDLSKVSKLTDEDLRVYPNDIIYIDPQESFTAVSNQIAPILSTITTLILLYEVFKK